MEVKVQNLSKTKLTRSWNTCSYSECFFLPSVIDLYVRSIFRHKSVGNVYFHKVALFAILYTI